MVLSTLPIYINSLNLIIISKGWYCFYPHFKDRKVRLKMMMALAQSHIPGERQSWDPGCWPPVSSTLTLSWTPLRRDGENGAQECNMIIKVTHSDTLEKSKRLGVWKSVLIQLAYIFGNLRTRISTGLLRSGTSDSKSLFPFPPL